MPMVVLKGFIWKFDIGIILVHIAILRANDSSQYQPSSQTRAASGCHSLRPQTRFVYSYQNIPTMKFLTEFSQYYPVEIIIMCYH